MTYWDAASNLEILIVLAGEVKEKLVAFTASPLNLAKVGAITFKGRLVKEIWSAFFYFMLSLLDFLDFIYVVYKVIVLCVLYKSTCYKLYFYLKRVHSFSSCPSTAF